MKSIPFGTLASLPLHSNTIRAPPVSECQSKEGGEATQGEVWRGRGAETYGKRNVLAGPLWEALLAQPSSSLEQPSSTLPQHLTFDDVAKVPETLAEP